MTGGMSAYYRIVSNPSELLLFITEQLLISLETLLFIIK